MESTSGPAAASNSGKERLYGNDSDAAHEIMLAYFPKKYYFLIQENENN